MYRIVAPEIAATPWETSAIGSHWMAWEARITPTPLSRSPTTAQPRARRCRRRGGNAPTIAALQYALIAERPYELTSDDVLFEVYATGQLIPAAERAGARERFFARAQACLRSSPLGKRYGWGIHHDINSRVALVPFGSDEYWALAADPAVKQLKALRSKRA